MKKTIYSMLMLVGMLVAFTSCEKDEIENTAAVETSGEWYVTVSAVDANGQLCTTPWGDDFDQYYLYGDGWDDPFGLGRIHVLTSNTAANTADEMIVTDLDNFWGFTAKVKTDDGKVFGCNNYYIYTDDAGDDVYCTITDLKITKAGAKSPSGMPVDAIEFYITFTDDPYPGLFGFDKYLISGFRYTGFEADE